MTRERNKPEKSWLEKAREELANPEDFTIELFYQVGKIRGRKEAIEEACKYLENVYYGDYAYDRYHNSVDFDRECFVADFKKFMED